MGKSKGDSILRIKHFSDSEDDGAAEEEDMEVQESEDQDEESESQLGEEEAEHQQPTTSNSKQQTKKKIRKKGIIYIGSIPKHMNVTICREMMEQFGEVGRIFLQPDTSEIAKKRASKKKNRNVVFKEGWVEFEKKKVAKFVAQHINNTPITRKKGSKFCDILWSLKYLPGFKWIHLSERLTYERAVQHQRKQMAIGKMRKEANFFQHNLDKSEKFEKKKKRTKSQE